MQQPEAYISRVTELFGEDGVLKNPDTDKFFTLFMAKLAQWISTIQGGSRKDS